MSQQHTPAPWTYEPASGWLAGKDTWAENDYYRFERDCLLKLLAEAKP